MIKATGVKDAANSKLMTEYTYVKEKYASRMDRMYVKSLFNHITCCTTVPVAFSDYCMVITSLNCLTTKTGKGTWKLNVRILSRNEVKDNFKMLWQFLKGEKNKFSDIIKWWNYCNEKCKVFFVKMSKKISAERYGLINLMQYKLKALYPSANAGSTDFEAITSLIKG